MPIIRSHFINNRIDAVIKQSNTVDAELHVEDDVPLMPIPRNCNSNTDDLEINLYMSICCGIFSQVGIGNATIQLGLKTSADMYSYRGPLFGIRYI